MVTFCCCCNSILRFCSIVKIMMHDIESRSDLKAKYLDEWFVAVVNWIIFCSNDRFVYIKRIYSELKWLENMTRTTNQMLTRLSQIIPLPILQLNFPTLYLFINIIPLNRQLYKISVLTTRLCYKYCKLWEMRQIYLLQKTNFHFNSFVLFYHSS